MILKIFTPKKLAKHSAFWTSNTAKLCKNGSYHRFLRKTPFPAEKLAKTAKNSDHKSKH
jgi:hypothetical protein